jgi:hypothetical protein
MVSLFSYLSAILLLAVFAALVAVTTIRHIRRDLLHPLVLVNGILTYFILLPGAYFLTTESGYILRTYNLVPPARSLALALGATLALYISVLVAFYGIPSLSERWTKKSESTIPLSTRPSALNSSRSILAAAVDDIFARVNFGVLFWLGIAGFIVGIFSYAWYIWVNGGPIRMLTVTPRTAFSVVPNTGRYRVIGLAGIFGGYVTLLCALRSPVERRQCSRFTVGALVTVAAVAILAAVMTRARMVILIPAFIGLVYLYSAERISARILVGLGTTIVAVGVGFLAIEGILLGTSGVRGALRAGLIHRPRLAAFMAVVTRVPAEISYQYGATFLEAVYINLPGYPRYGNLLETIAYGEQTRYRTLSAMLLGELWANFGPLGMIVGGVVYGAVLRVVYGLRNATAALTRGLYPTALVCIVLFLPTNFTWGTRGLVLRLIAPVVTAVIVAYVAQRLFLADPAAFEQRLHLGKRE